MWLILVKVACKPIVERLVVGGVVVVEVLQLGEELVAVRELVEQLVMEGLAVVVASLLGEGIGVEGLIVEHE
ncbi:hypothetical protein LINGRAHAP2_LOCUS13523 [Linum grandiflorum]